MDDQPRVNIIGSAELKPDSGRDWVKETITAILVAAVIGFVALIVFGV